MFHVKHCYGVIGYQKEDLIYTRGAKNAIKMAFLVKYTLKYRNIWLKMRFLVAKMLFFNKTVPEAVCVLIYAGSQLGRFVITLISEATKLQKLQKTMWISSKNTKTTLKSCFNIKNQKKSAILVFS